MVLLKNPLLNFSWKNSPASISSLDSIKKFSVRILWISCMQIPSWQYPAGREGTGQGIVVLFIIQLELHISGITALLLCSNPQSKRVLLLLFMGELVNCLHKLFTKIYIHFKYLYSTSKCTKHVKFTLWKHPSNQEGKRRSGMRFYSHLLNRAKESDNATV